MFYVGKLFLVPPRITGHREEEVSVTEGRMVSLLCDVQAYPPPEITWTRDGQVLAFGSGIRILPGQTSATCRMRKWSHLAALGLCDVTNTDITFYVFSYIYIKGGQMLQLPRARLEDAGQYVCTATNSGGQDQKSILLSVYGEQTHAVLCAQFNFR